MEKFSSIERIVGKVSDAKKENILQEMEGQFNDQEFESLKGKERAKTPEESQIISLANEITNKVRERYGLEDFNIPSDNIHVIRKEAWPKEKEKGDAFYTSMLQGVAICEQSVNIVFLKKVLHEMLHFKSYNALQLTHGEDSELQDYRTGLTVSTREKAAGSRKPGKNIYFVNLNEALTEEMTKRLMRSYVQNPLFAQEVKQTFEIMKKHPNAVTDAGARLFNNDTFYAAVGGEQLMGQDVTNIITANFAYKPQRNMLTSLIGKILEKNSADFNDKEEVFEVFAKAMMTGNLLPVGRLIDGTFGKGTLRRIGQLDGDIEAQEVFIKSL